MLKCFNIRYITSGAASGDRTLIAPLLCVSYRKQVAANAINAMVPVDHCTLEANRKPNRSIRSGERGRRQELTSADLSTAAKLRGASPNRSHRAGVLLVAHLSQFLVAWFWPAR